MDFSTGISGVITNWTADTARIDLTHVHGISRIELIADDIVRIRFNPNSVFFPRRSWDVVNTDLTPNKKIFCRETADELEIETPTCAITITKATGCLKCRHISGHDFAEDLTAPSWRTVALHETAIDAPPTASLPPGHACLAVQFTKSIPEDENYYGFGQRTAKLNRRYRQFTNWTTDISLPGHGCGHDNMYQVHPCFMAVRPGFAWGCFVHSTWYSEFDVGASNERELRFYTLGGELDYYLFTGPSPASVVEQLTRLTGRPALPPLWAMGFHQSRWSYPDEETVQSMVKQFRAREIPLDALHLDIDYMRDYRDFTWDPHRFPAPDNTLAVIKKQGVHTVVIVDPGVKYDLDTDYGVAREGLEQDMFIKYSAGEFFIGYCWPGESLFPDFCRATVRHWWGKQHRVLLEAGADGIWIDMNEPAIFDRPVDAPGLTSFPIPPDVQQGDANEHAYHCEVHNIYALLMARATYEGLLKQQSNKRPWVLTRSGYSGVQRYAVSWMGDNQSRWEHLEMSLPQLANMGLCGMAHVGVDIGGFYQHGHGELFARWMQLGTFYPFMRCHTAIGTRPQEPWSFGPKVERICKHAIELRYRLLPYIYTLAHLAYREGQPLLRPLFYEFPDQPQLYHIEDQVMLGPQLMIAPVYQPGATRRLVEIPAGKWYDFWTGTPVSSGPLICDAPLEKIPVFVRGGSLLTTSNLRQTTRHPIQELIVTVYPDTTGHWLLVEDDGSTHNYQQGEVAETRFELEQQNDIVLINIHKRAGNFQPGSRKLVLNIHLPVQPKRVTLDDTSYTDWHWHSNRHYASLSWMDDGLSHQVVVNI